MNILKGTWLSVEELLFDRMAGFHRQRVEAIAAGSSPLGKAGDGVFVVHLLPQSSVAVRTQFAASLLNAHGRFIFGLGSGGGDSRFNVDGLLNYDSLDSTGAYTQLFRDGRLESAMANVCYEQNGSKVMRSTSCQSALFSVVGGYQKFCREIGVVAPIWLFSALIGCSGAIISSTQSWHFGRGHAVDRSPAFLPELQIGSLEFNPKVALRPVCDAICQAAGFEASFNYDKDGNWHER